MSETADTEDPVRRLRRLWRDGCRPDLRSFLGASEALGTWQVFALLRTDQRERWLAGERVPLDDYVALHEPLRDDREHFLDLVYGEFLLRQQLGEAPDLEEYAQRFPSLAEELRLQIEVHRLVAPGPSPAPAKAGMTDEVLPRIPGYRVLGPLGRGGMALVFKAWQEGLDRVVALKMIDARGRFDPDQRMRFRTEAALAAGLRHPNIVQVYDVGELEGAPFFSLEYVEGGTLEQRFGGRPQPARAGAALVSTLARAMAYAHQRGIVHRDLKPANILLRLKAPVANSAELDAWEPKVADFGLAKDLEADHVHTRSGAILGTPTYMAPEQAAGQTRCVGPATDIHALGVLLYELLTGRPPFVAATALQIMEQIRNRQPTPPTQLDSQVPRDLETITLKCLEKEPARRYGTADELADDLDRYLQHRPVHARPIGPGARLARWCRRNPVVALLSSAVAASLLAGLVLSSYFAVDAREQAREAGAQADFARQEKETADRRLYVADMRLGQVALDEAQVGHLQTLLDRHRPERTGGEDLRGFEWHYWNRLCHADRLTFRGHTSWVRGVAWSPDGQCVASSSNDGTVRVWEARTGREVFVLRDPLPGADPCVMDVAFSPDGKLLASGGRDDVVRCWDTAAGRLRARSRGHTSRILAVAFSPDSKCLASTSNDKTAKLWDSASGTELHTFRGHTEQVTGVAFSPDGRTLATSSKEPIIHIWDRETGQKVQSCPTPYFRSVALAFSPDGRCLAIGGTSYAQNNEGGSWLLGSDAPLVQVLDPTNGQTLADLRGHSHVVTGVAFSSNGRLATCGADQTVRLWEPTTAQLLRTFRGHTALVWRLAFSPDGKQLASSSEDGTVKVWGTDQDLEAASLPGHQPRWIFEVAFSPDGRFLATAGGDRTVKIRDGLTGAVRHTMADPGGRELTLAFSADSRVLATAGYRHVISLWDPATGRRVDTLRGHTDRVQGLAFSRDGSTLASASLDRTVRIWDATTHQLLHVLTGHTDAVYAVACSADGRRVASASRDRTVRVWDAETGRALFTFTGHQSVHKALSILVANAGYGVAFSPDGLVASAVQDRRVLLWEPTTGRVVRTFQGHTDAVNLIAFSPDGERLATTSEDRTVRLWETASGEDTLTLRIHPRSTTTVAFPPDGHRLVSGDSGGNLRVWDATPVTSGNP